MISLKMMMGVGIKTMEWIIGGMMESELEVMRMTKMMIEEGGRKVSWLDSRSSHCRRSVPAEREYF